MKQCCATDGVEAAYIRDEILAHFFKAFWNHRMALDRRNYRQLVDTTVEMAQKVWFFFWNNQVKVFSVILMAYTDYLYPLTIRSRFCVPTLSTCY